MRALLLAVTTLLAAADHDQAPHGRASSSGSSGKQASEDVQGDSGNFKKYISKYAGDYEKYMHGSSQAPQGGAGNYQEYMSKYAADYQKYMPQHGKISQAGPGNDKYVSQYADAYQKYMKMSQSDGKVSGNHEPVTLIAEAQDSHSKATEDSSAKQRKVSNAKDDAVQSSAESKGQGWQASQGSASKYRKYMSQYAGDYQSYVPKDAGNYKKFMSKYAGDYQKYTSPDAGKDSGMKPLLLTAEGGHSDAKDTKPEAEKQHQPMESQQRPTARETESKKEQDERDREKEQLAKELSSERAELEAEMKRERGEREAEKEHLRQELMQEERQHAQPQQQPKTQDVKESFLMGEPVPLVLAEAGTSHNIMLVAALAGLAVVALLTTAFRSLSLGTQSSHTEYVQPPPAEV